MKKSIILSSLLFLVSIGSSFGQAIWVEERYDPVTGLRTGTIDVRGFFYEIKPFADLRRVDFRNVDLSKANLYGANMFESNLSNADLSGANLRLVNLSGANLTQTNLDDVIRIDPVLDLKIADLEAKLKIAREERDVAIQEKNARPSIDELQDARSGSIIINSQNGTVTITFDIEESDDLKNWQKSGEKITKTIQLREGKKFYRFSVNQ